jgi:hypothetical protein
VSPTVDDILAELEWARGYYPRDAVAAAGRMGTAIVPSLIGAIACTALRPIDRD